MTLHFYGLLALIAILVINVLIGLAFAVRWNILLRRLERTRNVGIVRKLRPIYLCSFKKNYEPHDQSEKKIYNSAVFSFKVGITLLAISSILSLIIMNISKVIQ